MPIHYIYKWTCVITGKSYIGKSTDPKNRWCRHKSKARKGCKYYFHNAIRKHGPENFVMEILCWRKTAEEIFVKEIELIAEHGTYYKDTPGGYNMTPGGDCGPVMFAEDNPNYGKPRVITAEWRKNMSIAALNKPSVTEETRKKHSESISGNKNHNYGKRGEECSWFGLKRTQEIKDQISESLTGREFSEEHKKNLSISAKNKPAVTEETRARLSESGKKRKKHKCPYCERSFDAGNLVKHKRAKHDIS